MLAGPRWSEHTCPLFYIKRRTRNRHLQEADPGCSSTDNWYVYEHLVHTNTKWTIFQRVGRIIDCKREWLDDRRLPSDCWPVPCLLAVSGVVPTFERLTLSNTNLVGYLEAVSLITLDKHNSWSDRRARCNGVTKIIAVRVFFVRDWASVCKWQVAAAAQHQQQSQSKIIWTALDICPQHFEPSIMWHFMLYLSIKMKWIVCNCKTWLPAIPATGMVIHRPKDNSVSSSFSPVIQRYRTRMHLVGLRGYHPRRSVVWRVIAAVSGRNFSAVCDVPFVKSLTWNQQQCWTVGLSSVYAKNKMLNGKKFRCGKLLVAKITGSTDAIVSCWAFLHSVS